MYTRSWLILAGNFKADKYVYLAKQTITLILFSNSACLFCLCESCQKVNAFDPHNNARGLGFTLITFSVLTINK